MAKKTMSKEDQAKVALGDRFDKLGTYKMATGGGEPIPAGHTRTTERRVMQPRDEEGRFAHNSCNLMPRKYPDRSEYAPAFLRGMEVKFAKEAKNKDFQLDGKIYRISNMTMEEFVKGFNTWDEKLGFSHLANMHAKGGKRTADEKAAIASNEKGMVGKDTVVSGSTFGRKIHQVSASDFVNNFPPKNPQPQPAPGYVKPKNTQPAAPTQPNVPTPPPAPATPSSTPKQFDQNQINLAKTNPNKFMQDHFDELNEIDDLANKNGYGGVNMDALVNAIASGQLKSFDEAKQMLQPQQNQQSQQQN